MPLSAWLSPPHRVASTYNADIPNKRVIHVSLEGESGMMQSHATQKDDFKLI